jgi:hypothetical protein
MIEKRLNREYCPEGARKDAKKILEYNASLPIFVSFAPSRFKFVCHKR